MEYDFCDYGCGRIAKYLFDNGRVCCSKNVAGCPAIKEKKRKTNIKKYGYDNPSKSPEIIKKISDVCMERYGVKWFPQAEEIKEKISETYNEKYGVKNKGWIGGIPKDMEDKSLKDYGDDEDAEVEDII